MNGQPPKPRRGCFFYGCITSLVLALLMAIALVVAIQYGKKKLTGLINDYTDTQPMTLPTVQMPAAEVEKLKQRFAAFEAALKAQRPTEPLELSADEINALIASGPDKQSLKGKVHVSFDGDRVKGELSLPLNDLGWKMFKNRYLNGSGTFNVFVRDGILFVAPQSIEVKGKPVPEMYMQGIRKQNFAQDLNKQADATAMLEKIQDLHVKDGKLIVVPKATTEAKDTKPERQ